MTATVLNATGPVSGNALALDPMLTVKRERAADWATARLWGSTNGVPGQGNRRMVAIGISDSEALAYGTTRDPAMGVALWTIIDY